MLPLYRKEDYQLRGGFQLTLKKQDLQIHQPHENRRGTQAKLENKYKVLSRTLDNDPTVKTMLQQEGNQPQERVNTMGPVDSLATFLTKLEKIMLERRRGGESGWLCVRVGMHDDWYIFSLFCFHAYGPDTTTTISTAATRGLCVSPNVFLLHI